MELVISKYWTHSDDLPMNYSLEFHGISPNGSNFTMHGADGLFPIEVRSLLAEDMVPSISLKTAVQVIRCVIITFIKFIQITFIFNIILHNYTK